MKPKRSNRPTTSSNKSRRLIFIVLLTIFIAIGIGIASNGDDLEEISLSELNTTLNESSSKVTKLEVKGNRVEVFEDDPEEAVSFAIRDEKHLSWEEQV